jgi:DNA replication protein DnaC
MAMKDDLEQLLKNLHLGRMAEILDQELVEAGKEQPSYEEFLARLLRAQWHNRQESALAYRIHQAKLPENWTLESYPYKLQPEVNQRQIRSFGELDFITKAENLVFIGPTGVGKTGLASGILLKALQNGHRGLFIKAQDLFDEMYASLADRSSRQLINKLAAFPLLVIDELGYLNVKPEQSNIFFKLMEERYTRRSTIITTPYPYCGET